MAAAKEYYHRSLTLQKKLDPTSDEIARLLTNLGNVAQAQDDLPTAKRYYQQALDMEEKSYRIAQGKKSEALITLEESRA